MEPSILVGAVVTILIGLFLFWVQRTVSQRDRQIEKLEERVQQLEIKHAHDSGKIETMLQTVNRIEDKL